MEKAGDDRETERKEGQGWRRRACPTKCIWREQVEEMGEGGVGGKVRRWRSQTYQRRGLVEEGKKGRAEEGEEREER